MEKKINRTMLEKRIKEKAEERFKNDFKSINSFMSSNPILRSTLKIKVKGIEKSIDVEEGLFESVSILFSSNPESHNLAKCSNIHEIKKELIEKYIKEETDNILSKLDNLNYLFNQ